MPPRGEAPVGSGEGVTRAEVLEVFGRNVDRLRTVLFAALAALPGARSCPHALDGFIPNLPGLPGE